MLRSCYESCVRFDTRSVRRTESGEGSEVPVSDFELTLPTQSEFEKEDYQDARNSSGAVVSNAGADDMRARQAVVGVDETKKENVENIQQQ